MNDSSTPFRSIIKGFSWRCISTLTTILLVYIFIGDIKIAGVLGFVEFFIKWLLFYIHDRCWHQVKFGKQ